MMMRRHATSSGLLRAATAGRRSATLAVGLCAILLALGGCSSDVWSKFSLSSKSSDAEKAAVNADDDTKCQSAGNQYGTPEYSQCVESLASKRATARDIPLGPTSAPTR
jgi:hypothetical protein